MATELGAIVALVEGAKAIADDAHQVNLRALDAFVRSSRIGSQLLGFAEVSSQMRRWSRELTAAVSQVEAVSREQLALTSALAWQARQVSVLEDAMRDPRVCEWLVSAHGRLSAALGVGRSRQGALEEQMRVVLLDLEKLGRMATVLSRAALIEASSGTAAQARELVVVSREFAHRSERVTRTVADMLETS